jgi:hypothetical protein
MGTSLPSGVEDRQQVVWNNLEWSLPPADPRLSNNISMPVLVYDEQLDLYFDARFNFGARCWEREYIGLLLATEGRRWWTYRPVAPPDR